MKKTVWGLLAAAALVLPGCTAVVHVSKPNANTEIHRMIVGNAVTDWLSGRILYGAGTNFRQPDMSPDGENVLYVAENTATGSTQVFMRPLGGGGAVQVSNEPGGKLSPKWSTGGHIGYATLVGANPYSYRVVVKTTNLSPVALTAPIYSHRGFDFAAGGGKVVTAMHDGVFVHDIGANTAPIQIQSCIPNSLRCAYPTVSHDGKTLAYVQTVILASGRHSTIYLHRTDTWQPFRYLTPTTGIHSGSIGSLDFSPDDQSIIFTARRSGAAANDPDGFELYEIDLSEPGPQPVLLTNDDGIPDTAPSTYRWSLW